MKESVAFVLAQNAVLAYDGLGSYEKLKVLRALMDREDVALFKEKQEEKENKNAETL